MNRFELTKAWYWYLVCSLLLGGALALFEAINGGGFGWIGFALLSPFFFQMIPIAFTQEFRRRFGEDPWGALNMFSEFYWPKTPGYRALHRRIFISCHLYFVTAVMLMVLL